MQISQPKSRLLLLAIGILAGLVFGFLAMMINLPKTEVIDAALMERGKTVYLANYCGTCHQLDYAETRGTFGPPHNNMRQDAIEHLAASSYGGQSDTPEDYIRESIVDPKAFIVPEYAASSHAMPAFSFLPDEDVDALVYLLAHQAE